MRRCLAWMFAYTAGIPFAVDAVAFGMSCALMAGGYLL